MEISESILSTLVWEFLAKGLDEVIKLGADPLLEEAVNQGYLSSRNYTVFICNGKPSFVVLKCPNCGESDLESIGAWIHERCGSISYEQGKCPSCGEVDGSEMVYVGPVYRCGRCSSIVNYPLLETECGDLTPGRVRVYRLSREGRELLKAIKKAVEELPDPKVTFVEVGGIKIEALLLGGEPEAVVILSRDEKRNRPERLREMGLKVRSIVI